MTADQHPATSELTVGQLASMSRLTIRALRHYDEIGLLPPARINPTNSYRYYAPTQLQTASLIAVLRDLDVEVATIRQILDGSIGLDEVVEAERLRAERQIRRATASLSVLESLTHGTDADEPTLIDIEGYEFLGRVVNVSTGDEIEKATDAFETLFAMLAGDSIDHDADGICFIHRSSRHDVDLEIGVRVPHTPVPIPDGYRVRTIDSGPLATVIHHGPLESLPLSHARLNTWILEQGHQIAGIPREVFLGDIANQQTRIEVPVVHRTQR